LIHPDAPQGLTVQSKTDTSVSIKWDAVSYPGGIKEYEIYRNDQSVGKRVGTSFSESGLSPETSYEFKVRAIANNGQISAFSVPLTVETEPAPVEGD